MITTMSQRRIFRSSLKKTSMNIITISQSKKLLCHKTLFLYRRHVTNFTNNSSSFIIAHQLQHELFHYYNSYIFFFFFYFDIIFYKIKIKLNKWNKNGTIKKNQKGQVYFWIILFKFYRKFFFLINNVDRKIEIKYCKNNFFLLFFIVHFLTSILFLYVKMN